MRIVILLVRTPAGELNLVLLTPVPQMPIDELRSVIRIESQQVERQAAADFLQRLLHHHLALAQQRPGLGPAGVNIGQVQGLRKLPRPRIPRMRNQVDLREATD